MSSENRIEVEITKIERPISVVVNKVTRDVKVYLRSGSSNAGFDASNIRGNALIDYVDPATDITIEGNTYSKAQINDKLKLIRSKKALIKGYFQDGKFYEEDTQGETQENNNKYLYYEINEKIFYFYKEGGGYVPLIDLPPNIALTDTEDAEGNVYSKEQIDALHKPVEVSQETTVHFRKDTDYGTESNPLNQITFDFTDAKRGVIQTIYFNGQELPSGVNWMNGGLIVFAPNTTFYFVLKWDGDNRVIGNLMTL